MRRSTVQDFIRFFKGETQGQFLPKWAYRFLPKAKDDHWVWFGIELHTKELPLCGDTYFMAKAREKETPT